MNLSTSTIRIVLPAHLWTLAKSGDEVTVEVVGEATLGAALDALESRYPVLKGTIRDVTTKKRRPMLRFFGCRRDLSHESSDDLLPDEIVSAKEPLFIVGAIAGG